MLVFDVSNEMFNNLTPQNKVVEKLIFSVLPAIEMVKVIADRSRFSEEPKSCRWTQWTQSLGTCRTAFEIGYTRNQRCCRLGCMYRRRGVHWCLPYVTIWLGRNSWTPNFWEKIRSSPWNRLHSMLSLRDAMPDLSHKNNPSINKSESWTPNRLLFLWIMPSNEKFRHFLAPENSKMNPELNG